nr:unnamed protein product [Callosobruchus chinensis]
MLPFVGLKGIGRGKPSSTKLADVRPQLLVSHPVMVVQEIFGEERFSASLTFELFHTSVALSLVQQQSVVAFKPRSTFLANIGVLIAVLPIYVRAQTVHVLADVRPQLLVSHPIMFHQEMFGKEGLSTSLAFKLPFASVNLRLVQKQKVSAPKFCTAFFTNPTTAILVLSIYVRAKALHVLGKSRRKPRSTKLADVRPDLLVSQPVMIVQEILGEESFSAGHAFEVFHARVHLSFVQKQIVFAAELCTAFLTDAVAPTAVSLRHLLPEPFVTLITNKRFLVGVLPSVGFEGMPCRETFSTKLADMRPHLFVSHPIVSIQRVLGEEGFSASLAFEFPDAGDENPVPQNSQICGLSFLCVILSWVIKFPLVKNALPQVSHLKFLMPVWTLVLCSKNLYFILNRLPHSSHTFAGNTLPNHLFIVVQDSDHSLSIFKDIPDNSQLSSKLFVTLKEQTHKTEHICPPNSNVANAKIALQLDIIINMYKWKFFVSFLSMWCPRALPHEPPLSKT